jgi:hypothetical protein
MNDLRVDAALAKCDAWEESKHPRAKDGKFGQGGSAGKSASKAAESKSLPHGIQGHLEKHQKSNSNLSVKKFPGKDLYAWQHKGKAPGRWYSGGEFLNSEPHSEHPERNTAGQPIPTKK